MPPDTQADQLLASAQTYWQQRRQLEMNLRGPVGGPAKPQLIALGDSWFDFPLYYDLIDCLKFRHHYPIENLAKAGACVYEMFYPPSPDPRRKSTQLEKAVDLIPRLKPKGILLSGTGNDFAGPEFIMLIRHKAAAFGGVNPTVLDGLMDKEIKPSFAAAIEALQKTCELANLGRLPVFVHSYDYAFPDGRPAANFLIKKIGPWMGTSFELKGYPYENRDAAQLEERRSHVKIIIDALHAMFLDLQQTHPELQLQVVNLRDTVKSREEWHDELHPGPKGFEELAKKFASVLDKHFKPI
jgi:hypothetical protein